MRRKSHRVRFEGGNGFDLAGIIDRPSDGDASTVLVFSHCFTCNKDLKAIVRVARGLATRGIAVLRFDMTGLGGSDGDFSETNFTSNLKDLAAAIRFASDELGPVSALMGHSFGGAASLAIAGGAMEGIGEDVRCVISLAAPSDTTHLAELLVKMDGAIESEGTGEVSIGGQSWTIHQEMVQDFRQHDLPGWIARIGVPTLLFHSPRDQTVNYDHALRIRELIQNSENENAASLVTLAGADHLLVKDARDIEFVSVTAAAFVNRYASSD